MSGQAINVTNANSAVKTPSDLEVTRRRLEAALANARHNAETENGTIEPDVDNFVADARGILKRAAPALTLLSDTDKRNASLEKSQTALNDLLIVIDEAADLLEAANPAALIDAVEIKDTHTAINTEKLPEAIATGDFTETIELRQLINLVDFGTLLREVDFRSLQKEKTEFDGAVANASDNLAASSDQEAGEEEGLSGQLQGLYKRTQEASDKVSSSNSHNSSRNPLLHSTVASKNRLDMGWSARLPTLPKR